MIDDLPPLRDVVALYDIAPKKALGQNFLFDLNLTRRIARAAGPLEDATVIEVGPGPGGLTRALLMEGAKRVVAIERDARCIAALAEISAHYPGRLTVVEGDAMEVGVGALLGEAVGDGPVRICANLPYNISTALLTNWLEADASISTTPPRTEPDPLTVKGSVRTSSPALSDRIETLSEGNCGLVRYGVCADGHTDRRADITDACTWLDDLERSHAASSERMCASACEAGR